MYTILDFIPVLLLVLFTCLMATATWLPKSNTMCVQFFLHSKDTACCLALKKLHLWSDQDENVSHILHLHHEVDPVLATFLP